MRITSLVLIAASAAFGQTPAGPAFDVASIKQASFPNDAFFAGFSAAGLCGKSALAISGNRISLGKITLCGLIRLAYDLQDYQVTGAPAWMTKADQSIYYDVKAEAAGDGMLTVESAREMLKALLADRFQLQFHRATKELPIYALEVGKNAPKLSTKPICDEPPKFDPDNPVVGMTSCKPTRSMAQVALDLSGRLDRPVLDKTGLTGLYAFRVTWGIENSRLVPDPDIFTAVQEQLGLKLDPQKAQVEVLVIDRAERPSGN